MMIEYTPEGKAHILECMLDPKDRDYLVWNYSKTEPQYLYNLRTKDLHQWITANQVTYMNSWGHTLHRFDVYAYKHEYLICTIR